MVQDLQ